MAGKKVSVWKENYLSKEIRQGLLAWAVVIGICLLIKLIFDVSFWLCLATFWAICVALYYFVNLGIAIHDFMKKLLYERNFFVENKKNVRKALIWLIVVISSSVFCSINLGWFFGLLFIVPCLLLIYWTFVNKECPRV